MIVHAYDNIRSELAGRLGREPREEVWNYLVEEAYVHDVWLEIEGIDYLEKKYRRFAQALEVLTQPPKTATEPDLRQIRLQILSDLIAQHAATEKSVVVFRRKHLPEGLLKREKVVEWITRQAEEEGPASRYLRVPAPHGYDPTTRTGHTAPPLTIVDSSPVIQIDVELLCYSAPGDQWARTLPVRHGGTLDSLRVVSKSLARRFTWREAQATTFILTNASPLLSSLRGKIRMAFSLPITSRINMEIDPTLTPEEVAERYKRLRARFIGARYRSMTEKHLRLAEFYGGDKPEGTTWAALMNKWNDSQDPGWAYDRFEVFARDCKQAWRRLMGWDLLKYPDL